MKKTIITNTYICDICGREYDTENSMNTCVTSHVLMVEGTRLLIYRNGNEEWATVRKTDHKNRQCLMECNNEERLWVGFFSLVMRNIPPYGVST